MTMTKSELKNFTEANRAAWNEVIPRHQSTAKERWDTSFSEPGFVRLPDIEVQLMEQVGLRGKSVAHLCCNNGIELLSLKNLGAGECVGFDISDAAIKEAGERATRCGIDCRFVRTDVYEIGPEYSNRFDIVYMTVGCLGWMPDLKLFFAKAATLLRKDGLVFIHEIHPVAEMLPENADATDVLRIVGPYFTSEPYVDYGGLDYVGGSQYTSTIPQYWFVHTLSDIMMGLIENRIAIERFYEYATHVSPQHKRIEDTRAGVPLSYILIGRKQARHGSQAV